MCKPAESEKDSKSSCASLLEGKKNYYSQGVRNATATVQDAIESFENDRFPIRDFPKLFSAGAYILKLTFQKILQIRR